MQLVAPDVPSPNDLARAIRDDGYVILPRALTPECVAGINTETGDLRPALNANWPGPVVFKHQRYMTHCLTCSRTIFDLMLRSWCFDVMRAYFGTGFRLTDQRVYVTTRGERMQWHVDNKFDDREQYDYPGLIFIFYLCDVEDGELQVIAGSHRWSRAHRTADMSDTFIREHHAGDVVSLKLPAGSGIVYNTSVVHRAHRIRRAGWERKSLLFQVEKKAAGGEPVLVNTRFAQDLTAEQQYFLGFGAEPEYETFPCTSLATAGPATLLGHAGRLAVALARSVALAPLWNLPPDQRALLKRSLATLRRR